MHMQHSLHQSFAGCLARSTFITQPGQRQAVDSRIELRRQNLQQSFRCGMAALEHPF
jgi:hypothetical protein